MSRCGRRPVLDCTMLSIRCLAISASHGVSSRTQFERLAAAAIVRQKCVAAYRGLIKDFAGLDASSIYWHGQRLSPQHTGHLVAKSRGRTTMSRLQILRNLQLCLVQSLRDVRDQIGRVFDADRQPDRGVENAYFLADVSWNPGMGHACGQAGKRLGAAQAHRQLEDLQRVQEFEGGGLASGNVERERGARAGALPREQTAGGRCRFVVRKVMDISHFGVVAQVIRDEPRVSVSLFHADAQCLERPADHPAGVGVQLGADGASQRFDVFHEGF